MRMCLCVHVECVATNKCYSGGGMGMLHCGNTKGNINLTKKYEVECLRMHCECVFASRVWCIRSKHIYSKSYLNAGKF